MSETVSSSGLVGGVGDGHQSENTLDSPNLSLSFQSKLSQSSPSNSGSKLKLATEEAKVTEAKDQSEKEARKKEHAAQDMFDEHFDVSRIYLFTGILINS